MSATAVVRARVNPHLKEEASTVLAAVGLTVSDAFRLLLVRIVRERALPFEPLTPNEETIAAMREVRRGKLFSAPTVEKLLEDLNEDH